MLNFQSSFCWSRYSTFAFIVAWPMIMFSKSSSTGSWFVCTLSQSSHPSWHCSHAGCQNTSRMRIIYLLPYSLTRTHTKPSTELLRNEAISTQLTHCKQSLHHQQQIELEHHGRLQSNSLPTACLGRDPLQLGKGMCVAVLHLHLVASDMGHRDHHRSQIWMGMHVSRCLRLRRGNDVNVFPFHERDGLGIPHVCASRGHQVMECIHGLYIQRYIDLDLRVVELHGSRWYAWMRSKDVIWHGSDH